MADDSTPLASLSVTHVYYVSFTTHASKISINTHALGPRRSPLARMRLPRSPPPSSLRRLRYARTLHPRSRSRPNVLGSARLRGPQFCFETPY